MTPPASSAEPPFAPSVEPVETSLAILVVCTGNICRSPLAAQLLRARLATAGIPATVTSAGTRALVGSEMTPESAALSAHYGGDPGGHRARQLTEPLIANADLVLTAGREHRSEVVSLHPAATRYTFTLNQFARLVPDPVETTPPLTSRSFVRHVASLRGQDPPPAHPAADDIEDPYRRSAAVYERSARAIDEAVGTIVSGLVAAGRRP